jgi:hypothetical protein
VGSLFQRLEETATDGVRSLGLTLVREEFACFARIYKNDAR